MFDFAWSEIALVGVVALVAIGPKDMPVAIKSIANLVKKARRMAGEFQTHVDDLMKEADLSEMRTHINDLRSLNVRGAMARAIDPDGSLRGTFTDAPAVPAETVVDTRPAYRMRDPGYVPAPAHLRPDLGVVPAFIPPDAVAAERAARGAPAFIPPEHARPPLGPVP